MALCMIGESLSFLLFFLLTPAKRMLYTLSLYRITVPLGYELWNKSLDACNIAYDYRWVAVILLLVVSDMFLIWIVVQWHCR